MTTATTITTLSDQQLNSLSALVDGSTRSILSSLPLPSAPRCLEVGAGNGSVATMIVEHLGGQVLAIDLDTTHLRSSPGVEVARHDIRQGVPAGPFDFIHARLVLSQIPARRAVFAGLVEELAPGGWLALADAGLVGNLLVAPRESDHEVWRRYNDAAYRQLGRAAGHDYGWAERTEVEMFDAGLADITAEHLVPLARGGGPWAQYHANVSLLLEKELLADGLCPEVLDRYRAMLADPGFRAHFHSLTYTVGRRPTR